MRILCFNVGSSGVRIAGFEGTATSLLDAFQRTAVSDADWRSSLDPSFTPQIVAHRIVRGSKTAVEAEIYTQAVHEEIEAAGELAPTHDPHALKLVAQSQQAFPDASQVVVYDTAFHRTIPPEHYTYALPQQWRAQGLRRIGYHGLSCAYAVQWLREAGGNPARAVHAHLGNGCSVTALVDGKSIATTMGYTPLEGVVMGTRSGSIDPALVLHLTRSGVPADRLRDMLFRESGLRALAGTNDMREIEERRAAGDEDATLAFAVYTASVSGAIAQMAAAAGGLDVLTFAGGIGMHSQTVRGEICARLRWMLKDARVYTLDVQEERMMAAAALRARMPA